MARPMNTLLGSSVTREVIKDSAGNVLWTIHYSYAGDSTPVSMNANGTEYYYLKNGQEDITHIVDEDGNEVASYKYDAWGNHLEVTGGDIAEINPYRYRGYRYDSETGLYYLQSRYYNPEWGRFISADGYVSTGQGILGNNMFAYCGNNPVNRVDLNGHFWKELWGAFTETLQQTSGYFAIAASISQADTVALGPADIVAAALILGGLVYCGTGATKAVVSSAIEKATRPDHTVYKLVDLKTEEVKYVGRTKNMQARQRAHEANPFRKGLRMQVIQDGLTRGQARAVEQASMLYYHTINTANKVNNQINGIAPKYWGAYKEIAKGVLEYVGNQASNEILYWLEK